MAFLECVEQTSLAIWVGESLYGYPFLLSVHAVGLAIVVGLSVVTSLRLLNFHKHISPESLLALIRIARRAVDTFSCVRVAGIAGMLLSHVIENIGMSVGVLPVTGIPLPFYSYGRAFMLVCLISIGLTLRVAWDSRFGGYITG